MSGLKTYKIYIMGQYTEPMQYMIWSPRQY